MPQCPNYCDQGWVYVDCPSCQGTGQVLGYDDDGQETLVMCRTCGGSTTVAQPCPVCDGAGEV